MKLSKHRISIFFFATIIAFVVIVGWQVLGTQGATYIWDNGGADSNWSTCANWSTDTCPGATDIAQFDGTVSNAPSIIDAGFAGSVAGIDILGNYTATIAQNRSLAIGSSGFSMDGGTFIGGSADIDLNGVFNLSRGDFTSTSGTFSISGNQFTQAAGSTFTHNGGTVVIDSTGSTINVNSSIDFNNLTFALTTGSSCITNSDSDILNVAGTLTLTEGTYCTTLRTDASGPVITASTFDGGNGFLNVVGGTGDIDMIGGAQLPNTSISVARTLNASSTAATGGIDGTLTLTSGADFVGTAQTFRILEGLVLQGVGTTFTAPSGSLLFLGTTGTKAITLDSDASFIHNSGTVEFNGVSPYTANFGNRSITLNNLILDFSNGSRTLTVATGDSIVVAGDLTLDEGQFNGPGELEVQGTLTYLNTFGSCNGSGGNGGTGTIHVTSGISISPTVNADDEVCWPGLELDNASASFTAPDSPAITYFGGDLILTQGTFNAGSGTVKLVGSTVAITFSSGSTFNHDNGIFDLGTVSDTGTYTFEDSDDISFYDLNVHGSDVTFSASSVLTIHNTIAISAPGGVNIDSSNPGVNSVLDVTSASVFLYDVTAVDQQWTSASSSQCHYVCVDEGNNLNWDFDKRIATIAETGEVREAGSGFDITISLTHRPDANVTIPVAVDFPTQVAISTGTVTFTPTNWLTPQTLTVTAIDDSDDEDSTTVTVEFGPATSGDVEYSNYDATDVSVVVLDNDNDGSSVDFDSDTGYSLENSLIGVADDAAQLTVDDLLNTRPVVTTDDGGDIIYDSINNSLWFAGTSADIVEYDIDGATYTSYSNGGIGNGLYIAHDSEPSRNRFWMSMESSDRVVAFNDDGTVFQTITTNGEVGFFDTPNRILFDDNGDATTTNDYIWVGTENSSGLPSLLRINAATGAYANGTLALSTFALTDQPNNSTFNGIYDLTYDPNEDAIWVIFDDENNRTKMVKIDASTGLPYTGSFATSTIPVPSMMGIYNHIEYDDLNDLVWVQGSSRVVAFDSDTQIVGTIDTGTSSVSNQITTSILIDESRNELQVSTANGTLLTYDIASLLLENTRSTSAGSGDLAFDSDGNIWFIHALTQTGETPVGTSLLSDLREGVTTLTYTSLVTQASTAVDSSAALNLTDVLVTETLAGQFASYSLSFDAGNTYKVWGSWRDIASNLASVHGGVNGTWYYRDNASTWAPASSNNAQTALSQAVAAGANNQMSGTVLNGLSQSQLEMAGGWDDTVDDIYLGVTLYSTDYTQNPFVDSVAFSFSGSGGPTPTPSSGNADIITPTNVMVISSACTPTTTLPVEFQGSSLADYVISEDPQFIGAEWQPFLPTSDDVYEGSNNNPVYTMQTTFPLSAGDGTKTIYVRFRSSSHNQTGRFAFSATLDTTENCANMPEEPVEGEEEYIPFVNNIDVAGCSGVARPAVTERERERYLIGISPTSGAVLTTDLIYPGDHIRELASDTVYCVTKDFERRPYVDEVTYFTHARSFADVKWVANETLTSYPLGDPMIPQINVTLVKFPNSPKVYYLERAASADVQGILRWLTTEEIAAALAGPQWNQYIIDINAELSGEFTEGAPYETIEQLQADQFDLDQFRKRTLLNEGSAEQSDEGFTSLIRRVEETIQAATKSVINFFKRLF